MRSIAPLLLFLVCWPGIVSARTVLVPEQEGDLVRALAGAEPGDVIDVAAGFLEAAVVEIGVGVTLRSRVAGANRVYRLIVKDAADPVRVEGFHFEGTTPDGSLWAGVDVWNSRATFADCRFERLQPGVFISDLRDNGRLRYPIIYSGFVDVTFERCFFRGNQSNEGPSPFNFSYADGVAPVGPAFGTLSFRECEFVEQENAIWSTVALEVVGCTFDRCRTSLIRADRDLAMKDCVVREFEFHTKWRQLTASRFCEGLTGPAIVVDDLVEIRSNTFVDSRFVDESQGGCDVPAPDGLPPFLYLTDDTAGEVSANLLVGQPGPGLRSIPRIAIECNDLFDVEGPLYVDGLGDRTGVDGNISADPQFCDREGGNFGLQSGSPAAGGGCGTMGAVTDGCQKVPVLVQGFRATREGRAVALQWSVAGEVELELWREDGEGRRLLARDVRDGYLDREAPGGPATYLLTLASTGEEIARVAGPAPLASTSRLLAVAPNPFNPSTRVRFEVGGQEPGRVRLELFDARGRRVLALVDGVLPPGPHQAEWDGRDLEGRRVASGVYRAILRVEGRVVGHRALVLAQ